MKIDGVQFPAIFSKGSDKVYIVIGHARSGTTFISSAIHLALRKLFGVGKHGRGAVEPITRTEIASINRLIDDGGDGSVAIERFLNTMRQDYWVMKDPRMAWTLEDWLPHFKEYEDIYLVAVFRKPDYVADSLGIRGWGSGSREEDLEEIQEYNERLIQAIRNFLSYGLEVTSET